ncbi:MAG TPA: hypothetical protein V6D00_15220 [Pantanalinema sp.]
MTFIDRTDLITTSPRTELKRIALYLQGDFADITVQGEHERWIVVLYKNGAFESKAHAWWQVSTREEAIALARQLERCLQAVAAFDDSLAFLPEAVRATGVLVADLSGLN